MSNWRRREHVFLKAKSIDKSYAKRAGILTAVSLLAKVIGALYRIPLTNVIGAEGVGLYQLVFSIYALSIAFTSAFTSTLISRGVSSLNAMGESGKARGYFRKATAESVLSAALAAAILFAFGEAIAAFQGAPEGGLGYRVIAPAVVLVAILSSLKGWFGGNLNLLPTALSIVIEQVVKLGAGISLALLFRGRGVATAAAAALGGVTISEAAATLALALTYLKKRGGGTIERVPLRSVLKEGLPLRLNGLILPFAAFADGLLIVRLLMRYGLFRAQAISYYGIYSGAMGSIVNFPVVLVLSLAIAVIPLLSRAKATRDMLSLKEKSSLTVKLTIAVSLPFALALTVLAPQIVTLLYPVFTDEQAAVASALLSIGGGIVLFLSLTQIYASLLQAVDKADVAAESLAIAMLARVLLLLALVPRIGAIGIALSTLISYAIATLLNVLKWVAYTGRAKNALKTLASLTASGAIMILAILAPVLLLKSAILSLAVSAAVGSIVYFASVALFKVFSIGELRSMGLRKGAER